MAIKFLNFDYDASNPTAYQYTASDWRTVQMNVLSNGIVLNAGADIATDTSLKVTAITGGVNIANGIISIQGSQGIITNTVAENVLIAIDGTYKIVMEFNTVLGGIYSKAIANTTALTRTATVWQLQIATVVKSGSTYTVTDTRTDTTLCGYANRLDNKDATSLRGKPISTTAPVDKQIPIFKVATGKIEYGYVSETSKKLLYDGSWSTGSITSSAFGQYNVFQIHLAGAGAAILMAKGEGGFLSGSAGYIAADALILYNYIFSGTYIDTTFTLKYSGAISQTIATSAMTKHSLAVAKIYGII